LTNKRGHGDRNAKKQDGRAKELPQTADEQAARMKHMKQDQEEYQEAAENCPRETLCVWHMRGRCLYGNDCMYKHDEKAKVHPKSKKRYIPLTEDMLKGQETRVCGTHKVRGRRGDWSATPEEVTHRTGKKVVKFGKWWQSEETITYDGSSAPMDDDADGAVCQFADGEPEEAWNNARRADPRRWKDNGHRWAENWTNKKNASWDHWEDDNAPWGSCSWEHREDPRVEEWWANNRGKTEETANTTFCGELYGDSKSLWNYNQDNHSWKPEDYYADPEPDKMIGSATAGMRTIDSFQTTCVRCKNTFMMMESTIYLFRDRRGDEGHRVAARRDVSTEAGEVER
jgi:hypothetical protein